MNKWLELLLGLVLVIAPIVAAIWEWVPGLGAATITVLKGGINLVLILMGLLFVMLGISDLKS